MIGYNYAVFKNGRRSHIINASSGWTLCGRDGWSATETEMNLEDLQEMVTCAICGANFAPIAFQLRSNNREPGTLEQAVFFLETLYTHFYEHGDAKLGQRCREHANALRSLRAHQKKP